MTAERLREVLDYDPATGIFKRNGQVCGSNNGVGYAQMMIDRKMYSGHRLAWLHVHGVWPDQQVDHINGDRSDNRIANLRAATPSDNCGNVSRHRDNKSGFKGVFPFRHKWAAQICRSGEKRHLGVFETPEAAHAAYCNAASATFGEFARTA